MTRPVTTMSAPAAERRGDAEAAQVGVGRQRLVAPPDPRAERAHVVAVDVGDAGREPLPCCDLADPRGEPGGVETAGVADDPHAALEREAEAVLDLAREGAGVPQGGVLQLVAAEDQHRQLGEVVAGQHVERTALEHLPHRREPVAVEARAVADPERAARGVSHRGGRPSPGGPAKACAMFSHRLASRPIATNDVSARFDPLGHQQAEVVRRAGHASGRRPPAPRTTGRPTGPSARSGTPRPAEGSGGRRTRSRGCGRRGVRRGGSGRSPRARRRAPRGRRASGPRSP